MKYDVVVVGAGPAGSTAAKNLAEQGKKVILVDKDTFPRDKPCGGGLPTRVMRQFPYIKNYIDSISYGSKTFSSSMRYNLSFTRKKPVVYTVLRKTFDYDLVQLAEKKGADVLQGKKIVDVTIQKNKAVCILEDGSKLESKLIIGCDGMRSLVAEKTHLCSPSAEKCVCLVQEQAMKPADIEKYFKKEKSVYLFIKTQGIAGYAWIFPKKDSINIGIGQFENAIDKSKKPVPLKSFYKKYIAMLKKQHILPSSFTIENLQGGTLPIFPLENTYSDRVLLCGDAAGFINPITGEGIYYAMASGKIAATVCSEALDKNDVSKHYLSQYQHRWYEQFGKDLKLLGRFNKYWAKDTEKIVRLLSKDDLFAKLIVGITGGRISASEYKTKLMIRYIYVLIKDVFTKN